MATCPLSAPENEHDMVALATRHEEDVGVSRSRVPVATLRTASQMPTRIERLRHPLAEPGPIVLPGCHDALSARITERAGFPVAFTSGAALMHSRVGWRGW